MDRKAEGSARNMIEVQSFKSKVYKQHQELKINKFFCGLLQKLFKVNCEAFFKWHRSFNEAFVPIPNLFNLIFRRKIMNEARSINSFFFKKKRMKSSSFTNIYLVIVIKLQNLDSRVKGNCNLFPTASNKNLLEKSYLCPIASFLIS